MKGRQRLRRGFAALCVTLGVTGCAAQAHTYAPPVEQAQLVDVEIYNRAEGTALPVYTKDRRRYVVGTPGHEYAVRIRNRTPGRVLVVTSVDGVNVISGDTASPAQSGYVLEPWGSVEILGWRKNLRRTAAFFFTEHENSYAARTGRPQNVGVIGVAVFRERPQPIAMPRPLPQEAPIAEAKPAAPGSIGVRGLDREESSSDSARAASKLGTGHGRNEQSHARVTTFERASETPSETIVIYYDRRENLAAMGVLPATPRYSRRDAEPFPGLRFAPDPR